MEIDDGEIEDKVMKDDFKAAIKSNIYIDDVKNERKSKMDDKFLEKLKVFT